MARQKNSLITIVKIPKITDDCFLFFAENPTHIPFTIRRIYFISRAKEGMPRGFHAHHQTQQVLFCIQGSIKILFDDGHRKESVVLSNPETGVFIDKKIWHEMHDFSQDTILLVLASDVYKPEDYIRDYQEFLQLV